MYHPNHTPGGCGHGVGVYQVKDTTAPGKVGENS